MNISVVIPNYNGEEILGKNLPKVFEAVSLYKNGNAEIVVIDDSSIDGSVNLLQDLRSELRSNYSQITFKVIKNEKNLGFSSTVNRGVEEAKGEIIILLNSDVIPEKDFLKPSLAHFQDDKIFAVGCMDKSVEDGKIVLRGRGVGKWKRGFLVHSRGEVSKTNTLWVGGGSGAFRKSIWDKLGGFNELYNPFYWEDIDLSYRALKSGYKIVFEPKSIVVHEHEKGAIKNKFSESQVKSIAYRNQFIFVWKNVTDLGLLFSHLLWLPYHFVKAFVRLELSFFEGFFNAFVLLPQVIKYKLKDQRLFILRDDQVVFPFRE